MSDNLKTNSQTETSPISISVNGQKFVPSNSWIVNISQAVTIECSNVSTTPLRQWGFRQCLPFSWTTLRGKHCRHPIAVVEAVNTIRHNYKQLHKVNDFDFCFVSKSFHISNSRTNLTGLDVGIDVYTMRKIDVIWYRLVRT